MSEAEYVFFDSPLYITYNHQEYLFTRGFIDTELHLSNAPSAQCEFKFQQKNYVEKSDKKASRSEVVVFGTQILIRHTYSNFYLSVEMDPNQNQVFKLRPDLTEASIFEILPQRTFQHKGDFVNYQSFFVIRNVMHRCYLGKNLLERGPFKAKMQYGIKNIKIKKSYQIADESQENIKPKDKYAFNKIPETHMQNNEKVMKELTYRISTHKEFENQESVEREEPSFYLPIYTGKCNRDNLKQCLTQKHIHTIWQAKMIHTKSHPFLQDNDMIYLISSNKNRGLLNVKNKIINTQKDLKYNQQKLIEFVKTEGQNDYICSAIFVVEIADDQFIYLKHLLTGKYFPFNVENQKRKLLLKSLLPINKTQNKLPPFHLMYEGKFYPSSMVEDQALSGFWLNKVNKEQIYEILSMQGFKKDRWIPYLLKYLDQNRQRKQQLLRQFRILHYIIQEMLNESQQNREIFNLLFKMINENKRSRKDILEYLNTSILVARKEYIIDVLAQIFDNEDNLVQKFLNPDELKYIADSFLLDDDYSVIYMRILRLFCGHQLQPCHRNQNIIFKLFFLDEEYPNQMPSFNPTESIRLLKKNIVIPKKFKFKMKIKSEQEVTFVCDHIEKKYQQLPHHIQLFLKQYIYLLGDCIKNNKQNLKSFQNHFKEDYSLQKLLVLLANESLSDLKGSILNFINAVYLQPQYKYKLYVFIDDYQSIFYRGGLISLHQNETIKSLLKYIKKQIDHFKKVCDKIDEIIKNEKHSKDSEQFKLQFQLANYYKSVSNYYKQTYFRHFLKMIKFSIENGYWSDKQDIELIVDTLNRLYRYKNELGLGNKSDYGQINEWNNYMSSTILCIDIATLYLDLQINLAISQLVTLNQNEVELQIEKQVYKIQQNTYTRDNYQYYLCNNENSQLIKKSLILSRKFYELPKLLHVKYIQAVHEKYSTKNLKHSLSLIKRTLNDMKFSNQTSIKTCQSYINQCFPSINVQKLSHIQLIEEGYYLNGIFKYRIPRTQFQIICFRLGVVDLLKEDILRYVNLRNKEQNMEKDSLYWKLLLLYGLIRENKFLKKEMSKCRWLFIQLVRQDEQKDGQIGLLALDILQQIYHDWRSLIISDSDQILSLCDHIIKLLTKDLTNYFGNNNQLNTRLNKLLNLITTFLSVNNHKIINNYQLIINELYDKENILKLMVKLNYSDYINEEKMHSSKNQQSVKYYNHLLFKFIIYQLTLQLEQNPDRIGIGLPEYHELIHFMKAIGRNNWALLFKIQFIMLKKYYTKDLDIFFTIFAYNINVILQLIGQAVIQHLFDSAMDLSKHLQLKNIFYNLPMMIKVVSLIVKKWTSGKHEKDFKKFKGEKQNKMPLIERLFLLFNYSPLPQKQAFYDLVDKNKEKLQLSDDQIIQLKFIRLFHFSQQELKNSKICLLPLLKEEASLQKKISQKSIKSRKSLQNSRLQILQKNNKSSLYMSKLDSKSHSEVKQFIKSLIYVNKKDPKMLDSELKTFFIDFLTSSFPKETDNPHYIQKLTEHQNLLIQYGTAELITIILEENYKESTHLFINLFTLANKLLQTGNENSQTEFLNIFKKDHKNIIFQNIALILQSNMIGIQFYYKDSRYYKYPNEEEGSLQRSQTNEVIKTIFRFLQLLCENDNQDLKNYIYSQTNDNRVIKYMSINFIQIAIQKLSSLIQILEDHLNKTELLHIESILNIFHVIQYIFDFLIQVCQYPAMKNQVYLSNSDFFEIAQNIKNISLTLTAKLQKQKLSSEQQNNEQMAINNVIFTIQRKIVLLIRGLLEQRNTQIIQSISKKINGQDLKYMIQSCIKKTGVNTQKELQLYLHNHKDILIEEIQNIVDILIINRVLNFQIENLFGQDQKQFLQEINIKIRQIQVDFKGKLTKLYFCYRPIFDYLSEQTKKCFLNKISMLQSRNEKLRQLINSRHIINEDITDYNSQNKIVSDETISRIFQLSIFLCFVLLALQLYFYSVNNSGIAMDPLQTSIVHALSLFQFLLSFIHTILWGANRMHIAKQKIRFKFKKESLSKVTSYKILLTQIYFGENASLHVIFLTCLSFFSCFVEVRLYSFVLIYGFTKIQILASILTAIRLTGKKLLLVCFLALNFTMLFGFLSINNYIDVLYENESIDLDIGRLQSHCNSLLTCLDSLFTQRVIGQTSSRDGDSHYGRFFSDTIYWVYFDIFFPNFIAAIIIDKFAELRNIEQKVYHQQRNKCFVCSLQKSSCQRKNEDFEQHINRVHCLWDYFYYLYYLEKLKCQTEYTGIQYWIVKQVKKNQTDWFPIDESLKEDYNQKKMHSLFELFRQKLQKNNDSEQ